MKLGNKVYVVLTTPQNPATPWEGSKNVIVGCERIDVIMQDTLNIKMEDLSKEALEALANYQKTTNVEIAMGVRRLRVSTLHLTYGMGLCVLETHDEIIEKIKAAYAET